MQNETFELRTGVSLSKMFLTIRLFDMLEIDWKKSMNISI